MAAIINRLSSARSLLNWLKTVDGSGSGLDADTVDGSHASAFLSSTTATQAQQEAASATTVAVTPGVQQYHPSAAKFWAYVTWSGGTPTLQASYNVTSITDSGVGVLTTTIATDFSSANWAGVATVDPTAGQNHLCYLDSKGAGTIRAVILNLTPALVDPDAISIVGFGDQ